ncbi:MAG: DUF192 domain-containing protein [Polyangiaceae bacterium]
MFARSAVLGPRSLLRATSLALGMAIVQACACQKKPDEPSTSSWTPASATTPDAELRREPEEPRRLLATHTLGDSGRCWQRTSDVPPPAVPKGPAAGCPADPSKPFPLPKVTLSFPEARVDGATVTLRAELAKAPLETERGLMYRREMPEDEGMLFDLGPRREHAFWMHNTCIPLDMLFVDDDGFVVGILENVPTMNDEERKVNCPSAYVLETNAGWCRRHGVRAGQKLVLPTPVRP